MNDRNSCLAVLLVLYFSLLCKADPPDAIKASSPAAIVVTLDRQANEFKAGKIVFGSKENADKAFRVFNSAKAFNLRLFKEGAFDSVVVIRDGEAVRLDKAWGDIVIEARKSTYCEFWVKNGMTRVKKRWVKVPELR